MKTRDENQMMELLLGTAQSDDRVRAVLLHGSRANPNAPKDIFQDYDIVYAVRDIHSFKRNPQWVDCFGDRIMMQMPEDKELPPPSNNGCLVYLMQFTDGNRIDLTLIPIEKMEEHVGLDSLEVVLLDKDGVIDPLPASTDCNYWVQKPTEKHFHDLCNEFWWICLNISKGLWRGELPYVKFMVEQVNRNVLIQMLEWYVGTKTDFSVNTGKCGKYLERFLTESEWRAFEATYADADTERTWNALFTMCELFRQSAIHAADKMSFTYNFEEDRKVTAYLEHVRQLPKDASAIYEPDSYSFEIE
ncbi:aminoglycoside 6-adenylyltransferase [Paenibacillus turpanensis]|uniref:aminoglycoside 6-adenylyltransferase n=1 Tax=Paenibacillus turpanensis TaxID=2689078 RepID=UPI00140AE3E8|nr:aminoglycoside 6-adenylyltransferase [Paenibacillus turpanensis]